MQKTPLITIALCFFILWTSCSSERKSHKSSERVHGTWQATQIVADGKRNDWPANYPFENNKALVSYDITNDRDNLYIILETGDQATELKILRKGLVVWIDKTGNKDQTTSICFPSDNENNRSQGQEVQGRNMMAQRIDAALGSVNEFFLQGFKGCRGKFTLSQNDSCGIKVGIGLDEYDQLVWEAIIPFKTFYPKDTIDRRDMGRPLDICFDIAGLTRPGGQGNNGMRPGGMSVGMGMGGMGFGMGGGMGGNRGYSDPNEPLYRSISFWKKVGIAFQQQQ
jgi:hypothetical protein